MSSADRTLLTDLISRTEGGELRWRNASLGPLTRLTVVEEPYKFILTGSTEEGRLPTVLSVLNLRAEAVQRKISETMLCGDLLRSLFRAATGRETQMFGLPFGVFQLGVDGEVLSFRGDERAETKTEPDAVVGRNFFTDILVDRLPDIACAFHSMVSGRAERLVETFHEVIPTGAGPRNVLIVMSQNRRTKGVRLLVLENRGN
jgi:hypothetical protein